MFPSITSRASVADGRSAANRRSHRQSWRQRSSRIAGPSRFALLLFASVIWLGDFAIAPIAFAQEPSAPATNTPATTTPPPSQSPETSDEQANHAVLEGDEQEKEFQSLMTDPLSEAWDGDLQWFRIEGNTIIAGKIDEPIPHNLFLCSNETYADFELRLEVRLRGEGDNAGVQFRTAKIAGSHEVSGYQADVGSAWDRPVWGCLYDESRRNKLLADPGAETIREALVVDDWNALRVRCEGAHVQIWLNDQLTVDYTELDDTIPRDGVIALQIHGGPKAEAWYRNVRIQRLQPPSP
jgi:hypothetical protein